MMFRRFALLCLGLWLFTPPADGNAASPEDQHVLVICIDGLPAYLLEDPSAPLANVRGLAKAGTVAEGMSVSNPSVTWPNHTSMVTGATPRKHGVLFNGVLERGSVGLPVRVDAKRDKSDLVRIPTVYDVLHKAGLSTVGINWPCTRNSGTLDVDVPDSPDMFQHSTPSFLARMKEAGLLDDATRDGFSKLGPSARDELWTRAACHAIRTVKPRFTLLHLLNCDALHHRHGPQTWAGYAAVGYADSCVGEVLRAVADAGLTDKTTVFIVADHGFMSIPKTIQPNVLLRQAGLLTVENDKIATARAQVIPEGGIGMVYLTVPETAAEDRRKVIELFREQEGIERILEPKDYAEYGLPQPDEYRQMADLILVGKDGYGFNDKGAGEDRIIESVTTLGTHGFLSTHSKMNAIFVASGAGVRSGGKLGVIRNIDLAPTVAKLFGVSLPAAEGRVLSELFEEPAAGK